MTPQPSAGDLEQLRDQLRAEIREARETLKDLRREIRDARTLVPLLTDELFEAEVKKQVGELGRVTEKAMDDAVARVFAKFDKVQALLMGEDPHSRRRGRPSIPDLLAGARQVDSARPGADRP
ncbi:hypothetical protein [Streptomyces sp. IBSBF 2435]|uniref:hypothetical protein n=1 Tax=Streptomyces sp. IBSBF 2435 TaxID=2903531 RepID=UPI002FDC5B4E